MAIITPKGNIVAYSKDDELLKKYKFPNKQLAKFKNMWVHWALYKTYYVYDRLNKVYYLPKTAIQYMSEWDYADIKLPQERVIPELWNPKWLSLRPQQQKLIDDVKDRRFALLKARTWFGKSYVIAWLIAKYKTPTLIIVPKVEIAKWLYEKFEPMFWDNVIIYKWKDNIIKPITIIVSASFRKYWEQLNWKFDMLIFDEAHMDIFWKERIRAMALMHYTRLYWLTATPERDEIDSKYFEYIYWPIIEAEGDKKIDPLILYKIYSPNIVECWEHWNELITLLLEDDNRYIAMAYTIIETMSLPDRKMWIVFVDRLEIAEKIHIILQAVWFPSATYTSKTQNREKILKEMEEKKWVIVATYQTVGVWFDYPSLNTWFFYMTVKFKWTVKQAVWRILRKNTEEHKPLLVDWQDDLKSLKRQIRERIRTYKQTYNTYILPYDNVMLWRKDTLRLNMMYEEYIGKAKSALMNYKKIKEKA